MVCRLLRANFCEQLFLPHLVSVAHRLCRSTFFLFIFTMALVMKAWFRSVAAALGDPAPAQTFAGIMLLILVLYTGYMVPKPSMIGALKWISYINVSDPVVALTRAHYLDSRSGMASRDLYPTSSTHSTEHAQTLYRVALDMKTCRSRTRFAGLSALSPVKAPWMAIVLSHSRSNIPTAISGG